LTSDQAGQLERLGFTWDAHADSFERNFRLLGVFVAREGHARVPARHVEDGVSLGSWVQTTRKNKKQLSPEKLTRLDRLGFVWEPFSEDFERNLQVLKGFVAREGHAQVPSDHVEEGVRLGSWIGTLRQNRQRLSSERIAHLEQVGFTWDAREKAFERKLTLLALFVAREGHARVHQKHIENGVRLGAWVNSLRNKRGRLSPERIARLERLGFIWDANGNRK
jgi:hypothetical protein